MTRNDPADNFGQSVMFVCPNVNPAYERGTYSIALTGGSLPASGLSLVFFFLILSLSFFFFFFFFIGFHELNNASVIVHLGEDRYPIAPPEDRILCEDVPDDVFLFFFFFFFLIYIYIYNYYYYYRYIFSLTLFYCCRSIVHLT